MFNLAGEWESQGYGYTAEKLVESACKYFEIDFDSVMENESHWIWDLAFEIKETMTDHYH